MDRRSFLTRTSGFVAGLTLSEYVLACTPEWTFQISLAEWSLHRSIFSGEIHPLDFPVEARRTYDIDAVEYVNAFFLPSGDFLNELKRRADGEGIRALIVMVDDAGNLGDPETSLRINAVDRHRTWVDIAAFLGAHSIRVNARSQGSYDEQMRLMADGLSRLAEYSAQNDVSVIVENHGGFSSNGEWLAALMQMVDNPHVGTLPDFGNWYQTPWGGPPPAGETAEEYNRYDGVDQMMPFAKGVSAKTYDFDEAGNEKLTEFRRMLDVVQKHGFTGYIGIEYEGTRLSEHDGILATKSLLEQVRNELTAG